MAWIAIDEDGTPTIFKLKPVRDEQRTMWIEQGNINTWHIIFDKGHLYNMKLNHLTWSDEPIEI